MFSLGFMIPMWVWGLEDNYFLLKNIYTSIIASFLSDTVQNMNIKKCIQFFTISPKIFKMNVYSSKKISWCEQNIRFLKIIEYETINDLLKTHTNNLPAQ